MQFCLLHYLNGNSWNLFVYWVGLEMHMSLQLHRYASLMLPKQSDDARIVEFAVIVVLVRRSMTIYSIQAIIKGCTASNRKERGLFCWKKKPNFSIFLGSLFFSFKGAPCFRLSPAHHSWPKSPFCPPPPTPLSSVVSQLGWRCMGQYPHLFVHVYICLSSSFTLRATAV